MAKSLAYRCPTFLILLFLVIAGSAAGQKKKDGRHAKKSKSGYAQQIPPGKNVLWEEVGVEQMDLFTGPGGTEMQPDVSRVEFIKQEKGGNNTKYRIKDAAGRTWVAKLGREARPETAAVRLLYGLGYKTEINYLVPTLNIPGKGTFKNVRLEARPDNVERLGQWSWRSNPFLGTKPFQGLKMMAVFMTYWDILDLQNQILRVGNENQYVISDLGATFGKLGNNNFPVIYRLGRSTGKPAAYATTHFIRRVKNGMLEMAYKGKNRELFKGISVADGRWLADRLNRLSDQQIGDAFRAANYSASDVDVYTRTVRRKIDELNRFVGGSRLASNDK